MENGSISRIPLVDPVDSNPVQRALFDGSRPGPGGRPNQWVAVMANHPVLAGHWNEFGRRLIFESLLSDRDREILTLRTCWRLRAAAPWGSHVRYARTIGMEPEEIGAIGSDDPRTGLGEADLQLVRAADELVDDHVLSDGLWTELSRRFDIRELLELCVLVGHYTTTAFVMNSAGVGSDGAPLGQAQ